MDVVVCIFPYSEGNPYQKIYADKLEKSHGVSRIKNDSLFPLLNCSKSCILVLDWISPYCIYDSCLKSIIKSLFFISQILYVKIFLGGRIIQNVHNLNDHEERNPLVERILRKTLGFIVDGIRFFSWYARENYDLDSRLKVDKGVVIGHPLYKSAWDNYCLIKDRLCVIPGNVRPYKGVDKFLNEFDFSKCQAFEESSLLIAGRIHPSIKINKIANVKFIDKFLSEEDFDEVICRSKFVLLPHLKVTTSGILYLVVSLGVPAIIKRQPYFEEVLGSAYPLFFNDYTDLLELLDRVMFWPYEQVMDEVCCYYIKLIENHTEGCLFSKYIDQFDHG